jgi:hypothetical protein
MLALFISGCEKITPEYKEKTYNLIIAKKYAENESTNNFGAFRTNHYFLYTNGKLEDVSLELYIGGEVGDTIVRTESYRVN